MKKRMLLFLSFSVLNLTIMPMQNHRPLINWADVGEFVSIASLPVSVWALMLYMNEYSGGEDPNRTGEALKALMGFGTLNFMFRLARRA